LEIDINNLAPVCLFVYNRPYHTEQTLEALSKNYLADKTTLYIYCDGAKDGAGEDVKNRINLVRDVIRKKQWCKEVIIKESPINKGLAKSVIDGVTQVINKFGKIIVLEDDIVTSINFLKFMNNALITYKSTSIVKQVTGYSFPVSEIKPNNKAYFMPRISTWGWGTWSRVWNEIDFECKMFDKNRFNKKEFNFYNTYNYYKLLKKELFGNKTANSWGIRFYFNIFSLNGLTLYPDYSLVQNIGWDGSGTHSTSYKLYIHNNWDNNYQIECLPEPVIDYEYLKMNIKYMRRANSVFTKVINRIFK